MSPSIFTEKDLQSLCQQVLDRCAPDQAEVQFIANDSSLTRFANNAIHQNVNERNAILHVHLIAGKRAGMASTNRTDPSGLDQLVARARQNAATSPEDPNDPGVAEPSHYQSVACFDPETAGYSPLKRARQAGEVCRLAAEKRLDASGAFSTGFLQIAVANSVGLFAAHATTHSDFQTVVMGSDSSGHAHSSAWRVGDISVEALGQEAIYKAERSMNPRKIDPGEYSVVLDPYATQDLVAMLDWHGMSAQLVQEGRSWINGHLGQKVFDSQVSIWDDGLELAGRPMPFDYEGTPKRHLDIVRQGVVISPVYDLATAQKAGVKSSGHALPPHLRVSSPLATNLFMASGETSTEDMIRETQRGLYITRFWYTRLVHPRSCVVTGMTRDGVFMIENGELTFPVKNLRFTQPYVQALAEVESIGNETRLLVSEYGNITVRVPAVKIKRFNFTGSTL
jgi:PmbA protein